MDNIRERVKNLSPEKKELLMKRLLKKRQGTTEKMNIPKKKDDTPDLASIGQEGLYFDWLLDPQSPRYCITASIRLSGPLDKEIVEKSVNNVIARHEVLRAIFRQEEIGVMMETFPSLHVPIQVMDISNKTEPGKKHTLQQTLEKENLTPFDLGKGPLIRFLLVKCDEREYTLIITIHHIVCDEWSFDLLIDEMAAAYASLFTGGKDPLPALPIQYADFASWQRERLDEEKNKDNIRYWELKLDESISGVELPVIKSLSPLKGHPGESIPFYLSPEVLKKIKEIARAKNMTLFVFLLAVYNVLLYCYCRQKEIIIDFPISNRRFHETEKLIGYFLHMLILRTDCSGNPTFHQFLEKVDELTMEAFNHQDISRQKLVAILYKNKKYNSNIINNVGFSYLDGSERPAYTADTLQFDTPDFFSNSTIFNLALILEQRKGGIRGWMRYKKSLFYKMTIRNMVDDYKKILNIIIENPDTYLDKIKETLSRERSLDSKRVISLINNTGCDFTPAIPVHEVFEKQAEKSPGRIAMEFESQQFTYKELNHKINRLAIYLIKKGVTPEMPVGISLDRSPWMIIGIMAILKAGGCYVPIDPKFPRERFSIMIDDIQLKMIISERKYANHIPEQNKVSIIVIDDEWVNIEKEESKNPGITIHPENLAYILFTSGSTGKPKGVMITHNNLFNYFSWLQTAFPLQKDEAIIQKTPLSFDVSVRELFWPFFIRAKLVIAAPGGHMDPEYLINIINEKNAHVCNFVPSMLRVFIDEGGITSCNKLKKIISGGEALTAELVREIQEKSSMDVLNFYGPTECTITSTYFQCKKKGTANKIISIGKPISNGKAYIIDEDMHLVPVGVVGELCIGGQGLARGYLNQPGLTAEKFIPSPFQDSPGERLYRTGDMARYLPDGNIEFLGRRDYQVKIRGIRIELGEIESIINQHTLIRKSLVVAGKDESGNNRLIAYLIQVDNKKNIIAEVKNYIKKRLPDYMIPSAFVLLKSFPLNKSGKIDRKLLPSPIEQPPPSSDYIEEVSKIENKIIAIWKDVLKIDKVRLNDTFFDLGGHSLLLHRVRRKVELMFKAKVSVIDLFEHPTVRMLAGYLEKKEEKVIAESDSERVDKRKAMLHKRKQIKGRIK